MKKRLASFLPFIISTHLIAGTYESKPEHNDTGAKNIDSLSFVDLTDNFVRQYSNNPDSAIALLPKIKAIALTKDSASFLAEYYRLKGATYMVTDKPDSAIIALNRSLDIIKNTKDSSYVSIEMMILIYNTLAIAYDDAGLFRYATKANIEALYYAEKALSKDSTNAMLNLTAMLYNDLASNYSQIENDNESQRYFLKAIAFAKEHQLNDALYLAHLNYGIWLLHNEQYEEAIKDLLESEKQEAEIDTLDKLIIWINLSKAYFALGKINEAEKYITRAIAMAKRLHYYTFLERSYHTYARQLKERGLLQQALDIVQKEGSLLARYQQPASLKEFYYLNYQIYDRLHQYKTALRYLKKYTNIADSLYKKDFEKDLSSLRIKLSLENEQEKNIILKKNITLNKEKIAVQRKNYILLLTGFVLALSLIIILFLAREKLRKVNRALSQKNEELNQVNKNQKQLITILGHDLKSPLGTAISFMDLLNDSEHDISPEERQELLSGIRRSLKGTHELIDNILYWSRSFTQQLQHRHERLAPAAVTDEILHHINETLKTKNITFENHINRDLNICTSKEFFTVIIRNLLYNAVKFSYQNGRIEVGHKQDGEMHTFWVKDQGTGISKADQENLFTSKVKHKRGTKNEASNGLGLIIIKNLIEQMGGKIWFESREGEGSTFFFSINDNQSS